MTCADEESCPVYLELASVEAVGNRLFLPGNIHNAASTLYSILLTSDDGGKTWREGFERLRGSGLDRVQFFDLEVGWVSGHLLHPLPRDPFLLMTTDGGNTWRRRPVFGESRGGSIQDFRFESRTQGNLIVEGGEAGRYERYESPNGGESWFVREVSEKPLRIRRAGGEIATGWRIRPHGPSKSYRLEKQQGTKWEVAASFSVPIGFCKPPEYKPAEPPAPDEVPEVQTPATEVPPQPRTPRAKPSLRRPVK
ncbi:MAG: hypothetical protein WD696_13960 [Bryobacteraceae bacterium]